MTPGELHAYWEHANVRAFSRVVREGESRQDDKAYYMRYGGHGNPPKFIDNLERHPRIPELRADGRTSTAAGAYQATGTTWGDFEKWLGRPADFSIDTQNLFFLWCLHRRGALDAAVAGNLEEACRLCREEWTSLPGGDEENAATKRARETYLKWGGFLSAAPVENTLETEHYGEQVTESVVRPVPNADEQEAHMAGFLAAALPALINAAPDLIRIFGNGKRSEENAVVAEKVGAVAMKVTGAAYVQEAAEKIASDPMYAKAFRAEVAENFDQWMGMMTRFHALDEASRDKARTFLAEYGRHPVVFRFNFVEFISMIFVVVAALGGGFVLWNPNGKFTTEMQTAVVTLMLIGGWNGVKEFWLGSSMGSMRKDERPTTQTKEKA